MNNNVDIKNYCVQETYIYILTILLCKTVKKLMMMFLV